MSLCISNILLAGPERGLAVWLEPGSGILGSVVGDFPMNAPLPRQALKRPSHRI